MEKTWTDQFEILCSIMHVSYTSSFYFLQTPTIDRWSRHALTVGRRCETLEGGGGGGGGGGGRSSIDLG